MASEQSQDRTISLAIPQGLSDWLEQKAEEENVSRETLVRQLLAAYRLTATIESDETPGNAAISEVDRFEQILERSEATAEDRIDERIEEFESEFMEHIQDVRNRVIQVKREADAKAPADHDHPEVAETIEEVTERVRRLDGDVSELEDSLADAERRLDAGFSNYEDILEHLKDTSDELERRSTTLARALVNVRKEIQTLSSRDAARKTVANIKRDANSYGITSASCADCKESVRIALLDRPECPHCSSTFDDVAPKQGLFGENRLETIDRPALTSGESDRFDVGISAIADDESSDESADGPSDETNQGETK